MISAVTGRHVDRYTTGPELALTTDSNPRSVPAPDSRDVDNRSLFNLISTGGDQAICSPVDSETDQAGYKDLGNGLLSYIDDKGREVWVRKPAAPHVRGSLPILTSEQTERFWSRVDMSAGPDACWPWRRGRMGDGYGFFKIGRRNYGAHRIAYMLAYGAPQPHLDVDHERCNNPPCCNPLHLKAVTHQQNVARSTTRSVCKYGHPREYLKPCRILRQHPTTGTASNAG